MGSIRKSLTGWKGLLCGVLIVSLLLGLFLPLTVRAAAGEKMLRIQVSKVNSNYDELRTPVRVEVGKQYHFRFLASAAMDGSFEVVCRADSPGGVKVGVNAAITQVSREKNGQLYDYTYSLTIPAKDNSGNAMTDSVFFIIRFKSACEGYLVRPTVYEATDGTQTELLQNGDFKSGLKGWFVESTPLSGSEYADGTYVAVSVTDLDESLLDSSTIKKMLHINKTKNSGNCELKVPVAVTAGKNYTYTLALSEGITENDFELVFRVVTGSWTQPGVTPQVTASKEPNGKSVYYTYSFDAPSKDNNGNDITGKSLYFIIRFKNAAVCEGNLFDAVVYETADAVKTQLLQNGDFSDGLCGWVAGFKEFKSGDTTGTDSNGTTQLAVLPFDSSLIDTPDEPTTAKKMLHINKTKNSGNCELKVPVAVTAGKNYTYTLALSEGITENDFELVFRVVTGSWTQPGVTPQVTASKEPNGKSVYYTYSFDAPSKDNNGNDITGKSLYFIIRFKNAAVCEGNLFDAVVYETADTAKTQLLTNGDFSDGLCGWVAGFKEFKSGDTTGTDSNGTTQLTVLPFDESLIDAEPDGPQMLHITKTSAARGELKNSVPVEKGQTYDYTFGLSNGFTDSDFELVCRVNTGTGTQPGVAANIQRVRRVENKISTLYTYRFTVPLNDQNIGDHELYFIIRFKTACEGDLFNPCVYRTDDADKTNLLDNGDFTSGLYGWIWEFRTFAADQREADVTEYAAKLQVVDFDEALLEESDNTPKMLQVNKTGAARGELMQLAPVTAGASYDFTFGLTDSIDKFEVVCRASDAAKRAGINAQITQVKKDVRNGGTLYTYRFTIPEKDNNGNPVTDQVFFIVRFPQGSIYQGALYVPSVCAVGAESTELLTNADFRSGLDKWSLEYTWLSGKHFQNSDMELTVVTLDESLLEKNQDEKHMLHIKTSRAKELMQRVPVKAGESYEFSFSLTHNLKNFTMVCLSDGKRRPVDANIQAVSEVEKDGYTVYTYRYTIPATYVDSEGNSVPMTDTVFFGMKAAGTFEALFFDASVHNVNDASKIELLNNPEFKLELNDWAWGWDAWFAHSDTAPAGMTRWENESTLLETVEYSDQSIADMIAKIPSRKMVYFVNGTKSSNFASRVALQANAEYQVTFSAYSTGPFDIKVTEDDARPTVRVNSELVSEEKHGNYTTYTYRFTMPDTVKTENVFVGVLVNFFSEGYIFDMSLYRADDPKQKNLWNNATFGVGLDGWIWDWHAWFGTWAENPAGTFEWTNGANTVKVMDFDLSKIDQLIAELNVNDGKWWNDSDIIQEDTPQTATLSGTLLDENRQPRAGVKLLLKSDSKTYTAVTDKNGRFTFKNFPAGFYELYAVDADGNSVSTGYFSNFSGGDTAALQLTLDASGAATEPDNTPDDDTPETAGSTLRGTVYTPQLKTVADLKIFLKGVGETTTNAQGSFIFENVPVGEYELYTLLEDGSKYVFRTVQIKENVGLSVKLKYDPATETAADSTPVLWIVLAGVAVLVIAAGAVTAVILVRKKKKQA